jgi:small-conductance mechanosensitive channel
MRGITADLYSAILFGTMLCGSLVAAYIVLYLLQHVMRRFQTGIAHAVLRRIREPVLLLSPVVTVLMALPLAHFSPAPGAFLYHSALIVLIATLGWTCIRFFDAWRDTLEARHRLDVVDNLMARRVITQVTILRRIALALVLIASVSAMLMTFPEVRAVGATLFASAGVAGLLLGFAARPVFTNILAGLQVALTEPIRIDDVVVVEGNWGWIEEIRSTYVVMRIWDQRRLMLPLSYFIEKPFENWTRRTADLLATVTLYVDYTAPVQELRDYCHSILQESPLWDGKAWAFQVTDATPQTLQLRALMSVANSGHAWDLRCLVREKLVEFLQRRHPDSLPLTRVSLSSRPAHIPDGRTPPGT